MEPTTSSGVAVMTSSCALDTGSPEKDSEPSQRRNRLAWLGPRRVVGVGLSVADDPRAIDHEPGRDRQCPRRVAVELREIERERGVEIAQVLGQGEPQAELRRHLAATVGQDLEAELAMLDQLTVVLGELGRDRHERGAERRDLGERLLKSYQLYVAVR